MRTRHPVILFWSSLVALMLGSLLPAQQAHSPSEHLGRPLGVDFELADWQEVSGYFRELAQENPNVIVEQVGTTTEGREFLLATVSSPRNLARLDQIRRWSRIVSDPRRVSEAERREAIEQGVPVLFVSIAMHSTETAAPQFGMEFAYRLATSQEEPWLSAREELVVLIAPCLNPDGLDHVVSWYRENVGTPQEGTGLTKLYQYYTGHDNNRDWFALTQAETRIVTRLLYEVWRPQVYWDVHQQGGSRERMFVPPFRDPLNPNLDPAIISGITALGTRAVLDMTREGLSGISTGVSYDMWWNGGNRNVPVRHNIIGLLTEAASVNIASPVWHRPGSMNPPRGLPHYGPSHRFPWPWPGGWWRLRDIIEYELAFGRSLLRSLSREPRFWLSNAMEAAERTFTLDERDSPRAWILPADNPDRGAVRRLAEILLLGGVELHLAPAGIEADGRSYPQGSIVILRDQPYSRHVKDLFELQRYPEGEPPYDVAGWTLPLLFGLRRVEVVSSLQGKLRHSDQLDELVAAFDETDSPNGLDSRNSDHWKELIQSLQSGRKYSWNSEGPLAGRFTPGEPRQASAIRVDSLPRIGLYNPWTGSMDEGWMRWVFDQFELPYRTIRNEDLRAGALHQIVDVLVVPSISARSLDRGRSPGSVAERFAGGLDPEGAVAVEEFLRNGGRAIAVGSSAAWFVELLDLPLKDATRGSEAAEFSCPGSVVRTVPGVDPLTSGLPASLPVFFSRSSAWVVDEEVDGDVEAIDTLLRYAPTRVLLSGYCRRPEVIAGKPAWQRVRYGDGQLHLFGFRPQYRGWSQAAFSLLFRALLIDEA